MVNATYQGSELVCARFENLVPFCILHDSTASIGIRTLLDQLCLFAACSIVYFDIMDGDWIETWPILLSMSKPVHDSGCNDENVYRTGIIHVRARDGDGCRERKPNHQVYRPHQSDDIHRQANAIWKLPGAESHWMVRTIANSSSQARM